MKGFNKLVLATAIIAASSTSFAMQSMDDESLSATTGQDGLTITLDTAVSNIDLFWKDVGGFTGNTGDGSVLVSGLGVTGAGTVITIDAGSSAPGIAVLNVNVNIPTLDLDIGSIYVGDGTLYDNGVVPAAGAVLTINNTLNITNLDVTAQLGNGATNLLALNGTLGTVTLGGLTITDQSAGGGGSIVLGTTTIDGVTLTGTTVNATAGGLVINTGAQANVNVEMASVALGTAQSIGMVKLANISTGANTMTVTGHP